LNSSVDMIIPEAAKIELAGIINNFIVAENIPINYSVLDPQLISKSLRHELSKVIYENVVYRFSNASGSSDYTDDELIALDSIAIEQMLQQLSTADQSKPLKVAGAALSASTLWWALRATGLLASLLGSVPTWRQVDLLAILPADEHNAEDELGLSKRDGQ